MAQFQYDKSLKEMMKMDGPLLNGPQARWQRKAQESTIRIHSGDSSEMVFKL
jgi:hypothetical protein